jgi:hypothetical protein
MSSFVMAIKDCCGIRYRPCRLSIDRRSPYSSIVSLVYENGAPASFATFAEAESIVRQYDDGPGDDVRSAYWESEINEIGWVVRECRSRRMGWDPYRERFGSDI